MQRQKKSLNPTEKELYNRAITDINFNVPRATVMETAAPLIKNGPKKQRDSSQGVPVGLKGLAAISYLRNGKNN